ncbi:hypothetical protein BBBOND_0308580 [Babesia bigemina]|uniref:PWI domain-containing protein n=1 Tax=Babesia bigemina TaxID=5866 RepID=A0A061DE98_BABBI|nr:hypothetical protein BBBOND_0308580 [Babesia bigemina]CDR96955.1 hypothetical protein BBBOND_0308580 [Babesia bigemina]|eukprot:XP_012769141.1 hypothetical protein BBBOND_0308580 [Babesia bigemina]
MSTLLKYRLHDATGDGGRCLNEKPYLDPKKLQINLTGFMAKNARIFVKELWDLLLAAQDSEYGIPQVFIDEKKREIAAIQGAANEVEDTLRQMGSSLPASNHTERDSNSAAEGAVQNTNEPSSAVGVGGEAESGPSEHRESHRQSLQSKRSAGRSWYETRKRANRRAKYPARRHDDSIRDRGHRRRRSPSSGSSRSSSESVSYRRRTHRRRSPSRSSSVSYSNRSGSSSSRSSSAVRRAPRHGRRRPYSSVSSDSPSPSEFSLDSRASRSVDSSVSRRSRGKRYESRRSRDRSVSHRRRRSSDSSSSRSSSRSSRSSSSSSSYRTRRRRGSGRRYRSRDRRSYS